MPDPGSPEPTAAATPAAPRFATVVAFYALLAVVATWPLVTVAHYALAGDARADTWKHAWGFWWFFDAAKHGVPFPTQTTLIGYPGGGSLYNIDPLNSMLAIPLQLLLPLPLAFNVLLLVNLVAGATAAWMLARRVSGDGAAAIVAGVVYAFCPFVLSYSVGSGVTETTSLVWLPLFMLVLLQIPERGLKNASLAGALLGLTAISCWYYGIFGIIWTVFSAAGYLLRVVRESRGAERVARLRAIALRGLVFAVICADVMIPPLVGFFMSMHNPNSMHPREFERNPASASAYLDPTNFVALDDFIQVGKGHAVVSHILDRLTRSAYVGGLVLLLAALALLHDRRARFWLASALLFGALALGPTLMISHGGGAKLPNLLYAGFFRAFPGFTQIAIPFRFCVPLMLSCGVLAALGLSRIAKQAAAARRLPLAMCAAALVLADFLLLSPAPWPMPTLQPVKQEYYDKIATDPSIRGVIDLPVDWMTGDDKLLPGEYFYNQSFHRKPIPYRVSGHMADAVEHSGLVSTVQALTVGLSLPSPPSADMMKQSAAQLYGMGFDVVILHQKYIREELRGPLQALLDSALGAPQVSGDDRIYRLSAKPGGTP